MTACCDICQHPACWKAEIDIKRRALHNKHEYAIGKTHQHGSKHRYDIGSESIIEVTGALPTYKILDLLKHEFGSEEETWEEFDSDAILPESPPNESQLHERDKTEQDDSFDPPVNRLLSNYVLAKLNNRQVQVKKQESVSNTHLRSNKIIQKTLSLGNIHCNSEEYEKVFTWIPGKKSKSASASTKETKKSLSLKTIDGTVLLGHCSSTTENKHHQKPRSQQTGHSYQRRTTPYHLPPLSSEDRDDYIELMHYIDLARLNYDQTSLKSQYVKIPSPLQTYRLKLYNTPDDRKVPKVSRHRTAPTKSGYSAQSRSPHHKTLYIRNGVLLAKSPVLKKSEQIKSRKRTPLPLTRVSVPQKAVKKLPLFDHCSSSIRKTHLPDVTMQPLSSGENSSVASSKKSSSSMRLSADANLLRYSCLSSPDLVRVPDSSPSSMVNINLISPSYQETTTVLKEGNSVWKPLNNKEITVIQPMKTLVEDHTTAPIFTIKSEELMDEDEEMKRKESSGKLYFNLTAANKLQVSRSHLETRAAPSAIMISKASRSETMFFHNESPNQNRHSPSLSLGSKASLDGWLLDKDIITRTYDKYKSFTPFKTPLGSAHFIRDDLSNGMGDAVRSASKRQILSPSLQNLDQYLPGQEESLRTNNSFVTRCLSPSRSMFIKQQKQPPIETVPSEIIISRFPILPTIEKSPNNLRTDDTVSNRLAKSCAQHRSKLELMADRSYISHSALSSAALAPVSTARGSSNADDYEEEDVEEVLLNKEIFSAYDFLRIDQSTRRSSNALLNSPPLLPSIAVSKKESNILLQPNQHENNYAVPNPRHGSALFLHPSHHGADFYSHSTKVKDNISLAPNQGDEYVLQTETSYDAMSKDAGDSEYKSTEQDSNKESLHCHDVKLNQYIADVIDSCDTGSVPNVTNEKSSPNVNEENIIAADSKICRKNYSDPCVNEASGYTRDSPTRENEVHSSDDDMVAQNEPDINEVAGNLCDTHSIQEEEANRLSKTSAELTEIAMNEIQQSGSPLQFKMTSEICKGESDGDLKAVKSENVMEEGSSIHHLSPLKSFVVGKGTPLAESPSNNKTTSIFDLNYQSSGASLSGEPKKSIMKDIFRDRFAETSSLLLTPMCGEDFMEGLDFDLELEEEIVRAMNGLEEFVLDDYDI